MGKCCWGVFDYDTEQGAKAFCIGEMLMGYLHFLISICYVLPIVKYYLRVIKTDLDAYQWILFVTYFLFMIFLIVQAVCGVLLYLIGYKKRNAIVCEIWVAVALFNFTCPLVFLFTGFATIDYAKKVFPDELTSFILLYLLYIDLGLSTVGGFIKSLKHVEIAPAPVAHGHEEMAHGIGSSTTKQPSAVESIV